MNNARQLGLACMNFESAFEHFPPGWNGWNTQLFPRYIAPWNNRNGSDYRGNYYGWGYFTLPYIEQNNLYKAFNKNVSWGEDVVDADGLHFSGKILPVHMCPSDTVDTNGLNSTYTSDIALKNGKSNYVGCSGHNTWNSNRLNAARSQNWGIFGMNSRVTFAEIQDGASNTILLGERSSEEETGTGAKPMQGAIWIGSHRKQNITHKPQAQIAERYSNLGRTGGNQYVVNGRFRGRNIASSGHATGASVAMADGSTHFLSDNLSNTTLRRMARMSDGLVLEGF
jgi:hypothetical protein